MAQMAGELDVPIMIGVGAAFDYIAGSKPHAPTYLRHVGLEWLFRLAVEPRRLWRRYLVGNSTFLWLLARERLVGPSRPSGSGLLRVTFRSIASSGYAASRLCCPGAGWGLISAGIASSSNPASRDCGR